MSVPYWVLYWWPICGLYMATPMVKSRLNQREQRGSYRMIASHIEVRKYMSCLTHCGLVTPHGGMDLGQYWSRQWLGAWRHQAITWNNVYLSSVRYFGIHIRVLSKEDVKIAISKTRLITTWSNGLPLWHWNWNVAEGLGQWRGYWCPGSASPQGSHLLSKYDFNPSMDK